MKKQDWILASVEAVLWFFTIYMCLYTIKNEVNLLINALIILILIYAAYVSCPLIRHMQAWNDMWGE